jgi:hypothetical protein
MEIRNRCKDKMSKECLARCLIQLEEEKLILKRSRSRKFVEYELNAKHPQMITAQSELKPIRQSLGLDDSWSYDDQATASFGEMKKMRLSEQRRHVEDSACIYAMQIAGNMVNWTFSQALMSADPKKSRGSIWPTLYEAAVQKERTRLIRGVTELYKLDRKATENGLDRWQKSLDRAYRVL